MPKEEAKVRWKPGKKSLLDDDFEQSFWAWMGKKDVVETTEVGVLDRFIEWLLTTGDGDVVMRRMADAPRQLWLAFPDEHRPWEEKEKECTCAFGDREKYHVFWENCPVHKERHDEKEPGS